MIEIVRLLFSHSSVKGFTNVGAGQPELDVVRFIGHGILVAREHRMNLRRRKRTLTVVRRTLTAAKATVAGVMLEASFARFTASMAAFSEERTVF